MDRDRRRSRSPQRSRRRRSSTYSNSPPPPRRTARNLSPRSPRRRYDDSTRTRRHLPSTSPFRRRRSRSRPRQYRSKSPSRSPGIQRSRKPLPSQEDSYRSYPGEEVSRAVVKPAPKEKPNFKTTGLLAADTNKVTVGDGKQSKDIVLKYHEPPEARKPPSNEPWSVYIFKGDSKEPLVTIPLHTRSCWLLGREEAVVDIPLEHPSCSKQHAVFQFRHITKTNEFGEKKSKIGLYLLDLDSSNGTSLNEDTVSTAKYVQCLSGDVIKFGQSSREYVVLLPPKGG